MTLRIPSAKRLAPRPAGLTAKHQVATPVNWRDGDDVIIPPAVSDEDARKKYPEGWKTLKPYLRVIAQPK